MLCNSQNFITRLQKQKEDALEYVIEHYSPFVNVIAYWMMQILNSLNGKNLFRHFKPYFTICRIVTLKPKVGLKVYKKMNTNYSFKKSICL